MKRQVLFQITSTSSVLGLRIIISFWQAHQSFPATGNIRLTGAVADPMHTISRCSRSQVPPEMIYSNLSPWVLIRHSNKKTPLFSERLKKRNYVPEAQLLVADAGTWMSSTCGSVPYTFSALSFHLQDILLYINVKRVRYLFHNLSCKQLFPHWRGTGTPFGPCACKGLKRFKFAKLVATKLLSIRINCIFLR